jgi:hypothetical protein
MANNAVVKMGKLAVECVKDPGRPSFWLETEGRFICPKGKEAQAKAADRVADSATLQPAARVDPRFKLIFLTVAVGTLLFTLICVGLVFASTGELPSAQKELVQSLLTMAKIGFGALGGLLGGKVV